VTYGDGGAHDTSQDREIPLGTNLIAVVKLLHHLYIVRVEIKVGVEILGPPSPRHLQHVVMSSCRMTCTSYALHFLSYSHFRPLKLLVLCRNCSRSVVYSRQDCCGCWHLPSAAVSRFLPKSTLQIHYSKYSYRAVTSEHALPNRERSLVC
jgi:hypothetical protein